VYNSDYSFKIEFDSQRVSDATKCLRGAFDYSAGVADVPSAAGSGGSILNSQTGDLDVSTLTVPQGNIDVPSL
jgi:hypothetical protein